MCTVMHPLSPPPDDCGDKTQTDRQGNDIDSYDECIHIQVSRHQFSSLTARDTTQQAKQMGCEAALNNAFPSGFRRLPDYDRKAIDPDQLKPD